MSSISPINICSAQPRFRKTLYKQTEITSPTHETQISYNTIPYYRPTFTSSYDNYLANTMSYKFLELISNDKPEEALKLLLETKEEAFNPNFSSSRFEAPIIKLLSDKMNKHKGSKKEKFYEDLARIVISHAAFNPNQTYKVWNSSKRKYDTVPILKDIALRHQFRLLYQIVAVNDTPIDISTEELEDIATELKYRSDTSEPNELELIRGILDKRRYQGVRNYDVRIPQELEKYLVDTKDVCPRGLDSVGGMEKAKEAAREFIIMPWDPKYRRKLEENEVKMPNGFLMYGPPGCGKTYISAAIASEMGIPMYEVDMSEIGGSLAHQTEKALGEIFEKLEKNYQETQIPSILFMDEIDAICARRDNSNTDWMRSDVSTVLKLINNASDKGIIIIAATNLIENVDPAALRTGRFDKKIEIKKPDKKEREAIFRTLSSGKPMAKSVKTMINTLVNKTDDYTCSDIAAVFQQAMRDAIFSNQDILTMKNFDKAIDKICSNRELQRNTNNYKETKLGFNPQSN